MKPVQEITAQAVEWAGKFIAGYPTIPRSNIQAYADGLARKSLTERDPDEALWCAARAEALRSLLKKG